MTRWLLRTALVGSGMALTAAPASAQQTGRVSFSKDVLPIFQKRCQNCHGVADRGGLKLDTLDNVLQGGAKGEIIIRGNPDQSRLMQYIDGRLTPRMPVGGTPLSRVEMATIGAWIQQGAQSDDGANPGTAAKPLSLAEPKDGADVKEKVKLVVPKEGIPNGGFVAIYIDDKFRVALAPPTAEDLEEQKKPVDSPLTYTWDTKAALTDDSNALAQERVLADGPHVVEVRSYDANGTEMERVKAQVNVRNKIDGPTNKPIRLVYGGEGSSNLGKQWIVEHSVELEANAAAAGFGRALRGAAAAQPTSGGPDKIKHKEQTKYLVSLEDVIPASGVGFYRERREGPVIVFLDNTKHVVRVDASSRYYSMERTGHVNKTKQMERDSREPIVNPLDLPGRTHRMNEPFTTNLRVHLGSYIPAALSVDRLQATLEGIEWQNGEQCARIRLTYVAGSNKVDINSVNIKNADLQIVQGNSTIWFSETTGRVIRAKHEITGNLMVDSSQFAGGAGIGGAPGMEGIPGEAGSPYGGSPYGAPGAFPMPGGSPYGAPGMAPAPGGGYGAPFGGGTPPSGFGGGAFGSAPGASPYGAPGAFPMPGGSPYGAPGMESGAPGMGGGTGLPGPKLKRYHVTLKVNTQLAADEVK